MRAFFNFVSAPLILVAWQLVWPVPAFAGDDLCPAGKDEVQCREDKAREAYWDEYGDRVREWEAERAWDPYFYFAQYRWEQDREDRDPPMIMAGFDGFKIVPWAFAIESVCSGTMPFNRGDCLPKLRPVSYKRLEHYPDHKTREADTHLFPKSREELAKNLAEELTWKEADLRSCKGALEQVEQLDDHFDPLWSTKFRQELRRKSAKDPEEIIVTTDGDNTWVEARSRPDPNSAYAVPDVQQVRRWDGRNGQGFAVAWSKRMLEIVQPCLRPSVAPPPWENALAAHRQWDSK